MPKNPEEPLYVVAVGASAGGLEAFELFLTHTPADTGLAFIFIQHQVASQSGVLSTLLQKSTSMRVIDVEDGMRLEPNCVYVTNSTRDTALLHGSFHQLEPTTLEETRRPIDFLFRALAEDWSERAIGVILSGMGNDGVAGLKAIKREAGLVIIQSPETTSFNGMATNAIETGLADFVLPVQEIPRQILLYVKQAIPLQDERNAEHNSLLEKVLLLLRSHVGHDFSLYKRTTLKRRIERRLVLNHFESLRDYIRYLQHQPQELDALFRELLIGVTEFFRDPAAFELLRKKIIPALFTNKAPNEPVRIWVNGCSTGEEAYSIAMLVYEEVEKLEKHVEVQIFATDIDSRAIEVARRGTYNENIATDVSAERLQRFFTLQDKVYRVKK